MAEAEDLKSSQCGFDPHSGHNFITPLCALNSLRISVAVGINYPENLGMKAMGKRELLSRLMLVAALAISPLAPASAADPFPMPPEPKWWKQTGLTDIRYGQWLPCRDEWQITNDCISAIHLYKSDGTDAGALTYQVPKDFKPSEAVQYWLISNTPQGEPVENSAYVKDLQHSITNWKLPAGIANSDGTDLINSYVHLMSASLQINTTGYNQDISSLPEGYYFEFKLKSSGFAKKIKWVLSNVRDPEVSVAGDIITVKGLPENSPSANLGDQVCEQNLLKAKTTKRNIAVNMIYYDAGNKTGETRPDDVILGTNGWWCLSDFRFDRESQQIIVKVGNVHFDEFGNEIQGWMELKVKGNRAREWWGIDPAIAAGYAKVEVSYPDGTKKVATVTAKYDSKNDWINLRAYGFTYSMPQLAISFKAPAEASKVVLVDEASKTVPVAEAKKMDSAKKMTITCAKGKTTKKISAVNPKCPKGYKKK